MDFEVEFHNKYPISTVQCVSFAPIYGASLVVLDAIFRHCFEFVRNLCATQFRIAIINWHFTCAKKSFSSIDCAYSAFRLFWTVEESEKLKNRGNLFLFISKYLILTAMQVESSQIIHQFELTGQRHKKIRFFSHQHRIIIVDYWRRFSSNANFSHQ